MRLFIILLTLALATPTIAQEKVTLLLDWFFKLDHGPIIVVKELGYFADLKFRSGNYSAR